jgi:hypothetical protein
LIDRRLPSQASENEGCISSCKVVVSGVGEMPERLKPGYYDCPVCNQRTFHYWALPISMQEFETMQDNQPLPDEVFTCARCASGLSDDEWERLNAEEYY